MALAAALPFAWGFFCYRDLLISVAGNISTIAARACAALGGRALILNSVFLFSEIMSMNAPLACLLSYCHE
jgi:hypothetical protein